MPITDEFGRHEVLHTASLYAAHWENDVTEHGALSVYPDLKARADQISELMAEFYQACGAEFL